MDRDTGKLNDLEEVHGHHSVIVAVTDQLQISHLEHNSLRFSWGKSMPNRVLDGWLAGSLREGEGDDYQPRSKLESDWKL